MKIFFCILLKLISFAFELSIGMWYKKVYKIKKE
jgi:hypothetical protein